MTTSLSHRTRIPGVLRALWRYRGFILASVRREFRLRYARSVLGAGWNLLQPLAMVFVYVVVFGEVMRARLPGSTDTFDYGLHVLSGMLVWIPFSEIIVKCLTLFVDNANLIKKASFPRATLLAIALLSSLVNLALIAGVFLVFLAVIGRFPGWAIFALVPPLLTTLVLATGLGILLGTANVFFRDTGAFVAIALQFWFWFTPIVYPVSVLPTKFQTIIAWNPVTPLVISFQSVLLRSASADQADVAVVAGLSVVIFALGYMLFKANAATLVDEL